MSLDSNWTRGRIGYGTSFCVSAPRRQMRHTRHALIVGSVALGAACATGGTAAGPDAGPDADITSGEPREQTADQQVKQAVNRLTFGPRPGELAQITSMGVDRWMTRQLRPEQIPDTAWARFASVLSTQRAMAKSLADSNPPQDLWIQQRRKARGLADTAQFVWTPADSADWKIINDRTNRLAAEIPAARVARAQLSDRELLEVMTDFWENHFSVFVGKMPTRFTLLDYDRDVIRPRALGKFRDLLGAVANSPAMLYYLDNWQSASDTAHRTLPEWKAAQQAVATHKPLPPKRRRGNGLNENYGRELMELHTLGVAGGYTQHDVIEVARALTGWSIQDPRRGGGFVFRPETHDADEKVVLGHHFPAGRGIEDGVEVLDLLARHSSTAHFIAYKLVRRFVSDSPPPPLVARAARTFTESDGDIRAVLRTIFSSREFFARASYKMKVKTPFEAVLSVVRALNAAPDSTNRTAGLVGRLGAPIFGRLTPDGYPETGDAWMNTGAILDRINFGLNAGLGRIPGVSLDRWSPSWTLAYAPLATQVDGVIAALLDGEASPDTRSILITGQNPLVAAGSSRTASPGSIAGTSAAMAAPPPAPPSGALTTAPPATMPSSLAVPASMGLAAGPSPGPPANPRLAFANLVGLALGSPEFQRR
ncbi:MAG: DUF1800 domain-containing protein [Gemmatimonadota bacterium]|nr:DUF1800 domain-containing protein [Gemmatimonadota bacterium]